MMTEKMKPSGITWIGDIPLEWEPTKIKYCIQIIGSGTTPDSGNPAYYEDGIFPWIQSGDLYGRSIIWDTEKRITKSAISDFPALSWYEKDFIVIAMYGASVGNVAISKISSYTNQACCVIKPRKNGDLCYFYYYLSAAQEDMLQKAFGGTQPNISQVIIKNLSFLSVPAKEQTKIADFLDTQCAKIDSVIADIEKQIETLQKYKRSLITEVVTKGLDISVPMQYSGIDWIGTIPSHWNIKKIKYVASKIGSGKTPKGGAEVYEDEGITFIRSQNVYDDGLHLEDVKYISENIDAEMHTTRLLFGDVLFNITGASIGRCCIYSLQDKGNVNQHVCIIRTNEKCYNEYLRYVLNSDIGKVQTAINQMGGNRDSLTFEQIGMFVFPLPPRHEQVEIANALRGKCEQVDNVINEKKKQLATIHQYKRSLIYEYVTGKKRVTEVN